MVVCLDLLVVTIEFGNGDGSRDIFFLIRARQDRKFRGIVWLLMHARESWWQTSFLQRRAGIRQSEPGCGSTCMYQRERGWRQPLSASEIQSLHAAFDACQRETLTHCSPAAKRAREHEFTPCSWFPMEVGERGCQNIPPKRHLGIGPGHPH